MGDPTGEAEEAPGPPAESGAFCGDQMRVKRSQTKNFLDKLRRTLTWQ